MVDNTKMTTMMNLSLLFNPIHPLQAKPLPRTSAQLLGGTGVVLANDTTGAMENLPSINPTHPTLQPALPQ
jgi:hypothetical protein